MGHDGNLAGDAGEAFKDPVGALSYVLDAFAVRLGPRPDGPTRMRTANSLLGHALEVAIVDLQRQLLDPIGSVERRQLSCLTRSARW